MNLPAQPLALTDAYSLWNELPALTLCGMMVDWTEMEGILAQREYDPV